MTSDSQRTEIERNRLGEATSRPPQDVPEPPPVARSLEFQRVVVREPDPATTDHPQASSSQHGAAKSKPSPRAASGSTRTRATRPDPLTQSLMLLATMALMLVAARFAVPRIVEEMRYAWHRGELRAEYETGTEGLRNVSLDALSDAYELVTAAVGPSVVHIDVEREDSLAPFTQAGILSPFRGVADQGSGIVVDADGFILTNRHVIAEGEEIFVNLSDGRRVPAQIVGSDALTDLAVLRVNADQLMPIAWGDSDRCKVGSPVWAVGSPFGLDRTVTFGILSGKHRMVRASTQWQDFMQSDVAVNPGNSGGPLVDARGTLIGINTAIVGDTYQGVSFSIPSNVARLVYERLRESGFVERAWLGVSLDEVSDSQLDGRDPRVRGAIVKDFGEFESPAEEAGLQRGDVIITMNDTAVRDVGHLMRMIGSSLSGTVVTLGIEREETTMTLDVKLGTRPDLYNGR